MIIFIFVVECKEHWVKSHEIITLLLLSDLGKNYLTFLHFKCFMCKMAFQGSLVGSNRNLL